MIKKKEEKPKEEDKTPTQGKKLQRKLKFKTLDGNIISCQKKSN